MELTEKLKKTQLFVMDVDGVLTNGQVIVDGSGNESKTFSVLDGHGIYLLRTLGIKVAIITRENLGSIVRHRARKLKIDELFSGVENKEDIFLELLDKLAIPKEKTLYIGDDYPDMGPMREAGVAIAVANALPAVKEIADYVTNKNGGEGAVREVIEMVLTAKGYEP